MDRSRRDSDAEAGEGGTQSVAESAYENIPLIIAAFVGSLVAFCIIRNRERTCADTRFSSFFPRGLRSRFCAALSHTHARRRVPDRLGGPKEDRGHERAAGSAGIRQGDQHAGLPGGEISAQALPFSCRIVSRARVFCVPV